MRRMTILFAGIIMIMGSCKKIQNAQLCDDARYGLTVFEIEYDYNTLDTIGLRIQIAQCTEDPNYNSCTCDNCPIRIEYYDTIADGTSMLDPNAYYGYDELWLGLSAVPNHQTWNRHGQYLDNSGDWKCVW